MISVITDENLPTTTIVVGSHEVRANGSLVASTCTVSTPKHLVAALHAGLKKMPGLKYEQWVGTQYKIVVGCPNDEEPEEYLVRLIRETLATIATSLPKSARLAGRSRRARTGTTPKQVTSQRGRQEHRRPQPQGARVVLP